MGSEFASAEPSLAPNSRHRHTPRCTRSPSPAMMYFSKLKTALIIGVCVLGVLFCLPNFMAAPSPYMPWRTVHLGLDLRGGSYLLLEVDMAAVAKERLDSLADAARTALRGQVQF